MTQPLGESTTESAEITPLLNGNWYPAHLSAIKELANLSMHGSETQPTAVFDFDNTCIFRDIGQAVFRFQAYELRYKLSPQSFATILPESVGSLDGRPLEHITALLLELYQELWPNISAGKYRRAKEQKEAELFTILLLWFVDKARKDKQFGPRFVLPFLAKLFAGFTPEEVKNLAKDTISVARNEELSTKIVAAQFPLPLGSIETSYEQGMQPYPEMKNLHHWLVDCGVTCNVISASTDWLVQAAAEVFNFPLSQENIFGIRVAIDNQGTLTTSELENYPVTFREGKVTVINKFIKRTPVFIAGDADTDYEMLTLPGILVRLIINRNQQGLIKKLYTDEDYLLQGINFSTGRFRPSRESVDLP